jgi:predicted Rossmann fold flavoprotein
MAAAGLSGDVRVFEGGKRLGRKLLLSGGGQCNITHSGAAGDFPRHYGENGRFLKTALHAFPPEALMDFFRGCGLDFLIREDGKIFPKTLSARSVLDALINAAGNAVFVTGAKVTALRAVSDGFGIETKEGPRGDKKMYEADRVLLAAGGLSYPETGSDGSGFALARQLGHSIRQPKPALCGLVSPGFAPLAGNSFQNAGVSVFRSETAPDQEGRSPAGPAAGRRVLHAEGSFLFTHRGVGGPVILNLSRYIERGDILAVNFLYPQNPEEFLAAFPRMAKKEARKTVSGLLSAYPLTRALEDFILARVSIPRTKPCAQLTRAEMRKLAEQLVRFPVPVTRTDGFQAAMVTAGGVSLSEVNPRTMESRIVPGLYFAGEILDIDGDEGGYNLQAAFSTARLASASICQSLFGIVSKTGRGNCRRQLP